MIESRAAGLLRNPAGLIVAARLAAALLGIGVQLMLARLLGPEQLGIFFLVTSVATVGAVIAAGGYPNIVLKIVAGGRNGERRGRVLAAVARRDSALAALALCALIAGVAWLVAGGWAVVAAVVALPAMAVGRLLSAYAMANRKPLIANLPDLLTRPVVMATGLALLVLAGAGIDAAAATWLFAAGAVMMLVLLSLAMAASGTFPRAERTVDSRLRHSLRRRALPLAPVSVLAAFFGDLAIVVSGLFLAPAELGIFALALKIALLVGFAVQALYQVEMPKIAAAHGRSLVSEAQSAIHRLNAMAVLATGAGALVVAPLAPVILCWFGDEFVAGAGVLALLVCVQVGRAYLGPSIQALTLVSAQRVSGVLSLLTGLALFVGCAGLAPFFGPMGAAIATGIAMLTWYGVAAWLAGRRGLPTAGVGRWRGESAPWRTALTGRSI